MFSGGVFGMRELMSGKSEKFKALAPALKAARAGLTDQPPKFGFHMTFDLFDAVQPAVETDRNARSGNAALSQFFTPFWVAEELVNDALRNLGTDINIAETSRGTGAFLAAIPKTCLASGVEIDPALFPTPLPNRDVRD